MRLFYIIVLLLLLPFNAVASTSVVFVGGEVAAGGCSWSLQDLSTYTAYEEEELITVTSSSITFAGVNTHLTSYVRKDFTSAYFNGDFSARYRINVTTTGNAVYFVAAQFTNTTSNPYDIAQGTGSEDAFFVRWRTTDETDGVAESNRAQVYDSGVLTQSDTSTGTLSMSTDYYVTVERDESTKTWTTVIRTGSFTGTVFDTITVVAAADVDYQYFTPFVIWDNSIQKGNTTSGVIDQVSVRLCIE